MATDRLLGNARGGYAWFLCLVLLFWAGCSVYFWLNWGGVVYLVAAIALAAVAVAGIVRLRRIARS
jgi:hypothetical protein